MSTEENRWLCRELVEMDNAIINGVARHKKVYELVWGRWEKEKKHKNGLTTPAKIVGESYHELHGPTACASIQSFCEDLNMRSVLPSKVQSLKKPPKNDPNQMPLILIGQDLGKIKPKNK